MSEYHIHKPIRSDLGFILCKDCDEVLGTPAISDLAYAERCTCPAIFADTHRGYCDRRQKPRWNN